MTLICFLQMKFHECKNTNLQLFQYKVIYRIHCKGEKLHKMGYNDSDRCMHCSQSTADTYLHAVWHHQSNASGTWSQISYSTSWAATSLYLPNICILGNFLILQLPSTSSSILLTVPKTTILLNWKSRNNITIGQWQNHLTMLKMVT